MQFSNSVAVEIYRFNTRTNRLEAEVRRIVYDSPSEMLRSVVAAMYVVPRSPHLDVIVPPDVVIEHLTISGSTVELAINYEEMTPYEEALFRVALVHTLTGLPFIYINGVNLIFNGEMPSNSFGETLGLQTREDVLISPNIMPRMMTESTLVLYFLSEDSTELIQEERTLEVPTFAVAHAVLEQLIEGSSYADRLSAIPSNTIIRDVRVEGGLCSLNLSSEFLNNFSGTQAVAELMLQSITRSIMGNVGAIHSIQFLIESERHENFHGVSDFDLLFERDTND
ncbi:MAG: GerMN domain-containing protein [Turicibacter sp.]|nr:GerMN domain-containing protein [Turicibacter sp.]